MNNSDTLAIVGLVIVFVLFLDILMVKIDNYIRKVLKKRKKICVRGDMMEKFDTMEILEEVCRATGKWGLYLSFDSSLEECMLFEKDGLMLFKEVEKATAGLLKEKGDGQILLDGNCYILFDTEEEMEEAYWKCVGDDGPTNTNPYKGPMKVYALTCSPKEGFMNENT